MSNKEFDLQSGKRSTFFNLFREKGYHVEIPIIQRDYAQGRATTVEIRESFLDALYEYLDEDIPNRDLDFIYGSLINNGDTCFVPLDGQQRLTTLFLLHWYLANLSGNTLVFKTYLANGAKSKFTYKTRTSSTEFCDALLLNETDLTMLLDPDKGKKNELSKTIRNCGWFYLSWENDPTIQSMLVMLDAIHQRFSMKPEFFLRLTNENRPIITFLLLYLNEFKLTDDLYIKMNARGKPLTPFETFKAKFEQHIEDLKLDTNKARILKFDNIEKTISTKEYFSFKIDTEWGNLFWNYKNVFSNDDSFDEELMNFIRVIIANQRAIDSRGDKNDKDEILEALIGTLVARQRQDYTDNITFHTYNGWGVLTNDCITYLIDSMDSLSNGDQKIKLHLSETFYFDEQKTFISLLKHELGLIPRVQFHAYVKYLIWNRSSEGLADWMRVIHNLSVNTVIDGAEDVAEAIKSIEILRPVSKRILDFLRSKDVKIEFFNSRQIQEEKLKAHLLKKMDIWKYAIEKIEKHPYYAGQIGFLLEFSGILQYYEDHNDCQWTDEQDNIFLKNFSNYSDKASVTFNAVGPVQNENFLWERAVLSKGDYLIPVKPYRKNLLSTNRNIRDYRWKRLFRLPPMGTNEQEYKEWKDRRYFVKDVFDDPDFKGEKFTESLKKICTTTPNDWRKYFIENPELIRYCQQGFIRFETESKILLFKESQMNHYHREMYSYVLFLKRFNQKDIFLPFKDEAEALAIANDTQFGLGAGLWTRDMNRAYRMGRAIQAGLVWTNCYHHYPAHAAFGGYKKSGVGRENHKMMLDHYQQTKNMLISYDINPLGFF